MPDDPIRDHIIAIDSRPEAETRRLTTHVLLACWPAGGEDRMNTAALGWLRQWRPARAAAALPTCSCRAGRCMMCN